MLAALLPVRDNRDRVTAYELSTYPLTGVPGTNSADDDAHATLELLSTLPLPRLTGGRSVHVPVTPTLLREGALSRFASVDAVFVIATQALEDQTTRRTVERLIASGFRFGLDGFPEGVDAIPPSLAGATIALDAGRVSALTMASRVQSLLHVGLKPIVRSVDDRATRERVLSQGVPYYTGRIMLRGAMRDADSESSVKRAVTMLTAFSDGRPPDATFDVFVRNNARLSAELVHMMRSSTMGVRLPRTAENALTVLGFDAVLERAAALVARMAGDAAGDAELALIGLRRARACERLAAGLERAPHNRARVLAGLITVLDAAFGIPATAVPTQIVLTPALNDVMVDRAEPLGQLLDLIEAYESGWWPDVFARCHALGLSPMLVREAYFDAWRDARNELGGMRPADAA